MSNPLVCEWCDDTCNALYRFDSPRAHVFVCATCYRTIRAKANSANGGCTCETCTAGVELPFPAYTHDGNGSEQPMKESVRKMSGLVILDVFPFASLAVEIRQRLEFVRWLHTERNAFSDDMVSIAPYMECIMCEAPLLPRDSASGTYDCPSCGTIRTVGW